jgi:hypothetical protein
MMVLAASRSDPGKQQCQWISNHSAAIGSAANLDLGALIAQLST